VRFFNASSRGAPLFSAHRRGFRVAYDQDRSVVTADRAPPRTRSLARDKNEDRPFARVIRDQPLAGAGAGAGAGAAVPASAAACAAAFARAALRISSRAIFLASMSSTLVGEGAAELSSRKKSRGTSPVAATKVRRDARRVAHPAHAHFGEHCASPQDAQTTRSGPETGRRVAARRAGPRALELRRVVTRRGHGRESRGSDAARPRETAKTTRVESICAEKWYPSSRDGAAVGCGAGCSYLEDAATGEQMNVLRETDMVSGEVDEVHACACARRNASVPYESTSAAT